MSYLISVIIPTYNSGDSLQGLMDSLINQSFQNFEVILMDGLSQDHSLETAQAYQEFFKDRLIIHSAKDHGVYDAMNKGIERTKGSWLFFIGSDDNIYSPSTFLEVSRVLQYTSSHVVYGNVLIHGDTGWANDGDLYDGEFNLEKLLMKNICHQAIFYRREMFEMYGNYNIRYSVCADYDLNLRFFAKTKYEFTPLVVADFFGGGASTAFFDRLFFRDKNQKVVEYFLHHPYADLFDKISRTSQSTTFRMFGLKYRFVVNRVRAKWESCRVPIKRPENKITNQERTPLWLKKP